MLQGILRFHFTQNVHCCLDALTAQSLIHLLSTVCWPQFCLCWELRMGAGVGRHVLVFRDSRSAFISAILILHFLLPHLFRPIPPCLMARARPSFCLWSLLLARSQHSHTVLVRISVFMQGRPTLLSEHHQSSKAQPRWPFLMMLGILQPHWLTCGGSLAPISYSL